MVLLREGRARFGEELKGKKQREGKSNGNGREKECDEGGKGKERGTTPYLSRGPLKS